MPVEIREAVESDAGAIAGLLGQMGYPATADQVAARLGRLAASGHVRNLVAILDGRLVGLTSVHFEPVLHHDEPYARLMIMVVDEELRSRGIGRQLMEATMDAARAAGCDRMELTSRTERARAHAFYQSLGFEVQSTKFVRKL